MNSSLLEYIGIDPAYILIGMLVLWIVIFILLIVALTKVKGLRRRYERFLSGKDAENMEDAIIAKFDEIESLKSVNKNHRMELDAIQNTLKVTFQKVGIMKYDAFAEMGGNLSFALALLDKENNGVILNAIHSREGCYTYVKDIHNLKCDIELSDEEKQALEIALNSN